MKKRTFFVLLIVIYLISFGVNLYPAIKYPDVAPQIPHLLISFIFVMILFFSIKYKSRLIQGIAAAGMLAGSFVFLLKRLEMMDANLFIELLFNLHYPLYILFITPFFGLNVLLYVDYGTFSVLTSVLFAIVYVVIYVRRQDEA